ncbi:MAG: hypothetical protein ACM3JB_07215 [Acidobacteriaceae bacterium]
MSGEKNSTVRRVRVSQERRLLELLEAANGAEVSAVDVQRTAGLQYSRAVHSLRHKGYEIVNRTEIRDGVRHGWFKLIVPNAGTCKVNTSRQGQLLALPQPVRHRDDG